MTPPGDPTAWLVALPARHLSVPPYVLRPAALLVHDLGIDRPAAVECGMTIEHAGRSGSTSGEVTALVRRLTRPAAPDPAV